MNESSEASKKPLSRIALWVPTIYYAQGLPFSLARQMSVVFFKDMGVSLSSLGLTSLYGIPWTFKFLWSPFVDKFSTKKRWVIAMEIILLSILFLMSFLTTMNMSAQVFAALFLVLAFVAATHDIAIDGLYLDSLEKSQQAKFSGVQQLGYRLAMLTGSGLLVSVAGKYNWMTAFGTAAAVFGFLIFWHLKFLPGKPAVTHEVQEKQKFYDGFIAFLKLPKVYWAIAFILLFRLGEVLMLGMATPFMLDMGMTKVQLGLYSGVFGVIATISATITGGLLISKYGLSKMLWALGFTQNLAIPIYAVAAFMKPDVHILALAIIVEQIANGLGNAVYSNFIMRQNDPKFKATHFAIATGMMSLTTMLGGLLSGFGAQAYGYGVFFLLAFAASIPGLILIPIISKRPECQLKR